MAETFQEAIDAGNINAVKEMLKENSKICSEYIQWEVNRRESPIHRAINQNQTEIALLFLQQKKSLVSQLIKHQDFRGETALHRCGWCGRAEVAKKLLKAGSKPNMPNLLGLTPLHLAAERGKLDVVEILLKYKANVNCKSNQGNTPLHRATTGGHEDVIAALIRAGAEAEIQNHKGNRAGGKFTTSELLQRAESKINRSGKTIRDLKQDGATGGSAPTLRYEVEAAKVPGIDFRYYEIRPDQVMYGHKLGEGGFGTVYEGTVAGQPVALKQLTSSHARVHENFRKELDVMCKLRHPNIVLLLGAVIQPDQLCLVMEICQGGSLTSLLKFRELNINEVVWVGRQIAMAMNWLHSRSPPILHLDLKPANILLADLHSLHVKVSDFGLARSTISDSKAIVGTRRFMAPEMMRKLPVTERADVYSFGVLLWQIFTRKKPFSRYKNLKTVQEKSEFSDAVWNGYRPPISLSAPPLLANLINRCWATDSNSRPVFSQIIQWLDQVMLYNSFSDKTAQVFWDLTTSECSDRTHVRWKHFKTTLLNSFSNPDGFDWGGFPLLICDPKSPNSELVRMERFSKLVDTFGPFHPPQDFVNRVNRLIQAEYRTYDSEELHGIYYSFCERDRAIALLVGRPVGTFLLRNSSLNSDIRNPFIISHVTNDSISHTKVYFDKNTLCYSVGPFVSLPMEPLEKFLLSDKVLVGLGLKFSTHEESD